MTDTHGWLFNNPDAGIGRLLMVTVRGEPIRVLDVTNGSLEPDGSRRRFHLGAMPGARTVHEAVAASYGINPAVYVEAVRT